MADSDGRVVFEITGDNSDIQRVLRDTTNEIRQESSRWDDAARQSSDNMSQAFGRAFNVERIKDFALQAGKWLLQFGKDAVNAASDLQEVQNVVDVTFGQSASVIDEWAKNARTQFGLTETQAKKFASTIGATLKSTGVDSSELVTMSESLAGLAADMASFYNLDFEEAFQKIRSGISGQAEPLKQLGINMSEANLQAFALAQGIDKAWNKMTQAEQTMLRYQYIMQATADAQGDFARTQDSYANSVRALETSFEELKTKLGEVLIPTITEAINWVTDLVNAMIPDEGFTTVLDTFNDIELDTAAKLQQIEETRTAAEELIQILETMEGTNVPGKQMEDFFSGLGGSLETLNTSVDGAKNKQSAQTIKDILDTFNENAKTDRAAAWDQLLSSLSNNIGALANVTGKDPTEVKDWLNGVAEATNSINPTDVSSWQQLIDMLIEGIPGLDASDGLTFDTTNISKVLNDTSSALSGMNDAVNGAKKADYRTTLAGVFGAFNDAVAVGDNAQAWDTLLGSLAENIPALSELTGKSPEEIESWLTTLGNAANTLDPNSAEGWSQLMAMLTSGLPGLSLSEDGAIDTSVMAEAGQQANQYTQYLAALGIQTDEITDAQGAWLQVCKNLIQLIPGLSSIINTETGEIEGGVEALREYTEEWYNAAYLEAYKQDVQRRREALHAAYADQYQLWGDAALKRARATNLENAFNEALVAAGISERDVEAAWLAAQGANHAGERSAAAAMPGAAFFEQWQEVIAARNEAEKAEEKYLTYTEDLRTADQALTDEMQAVIDRTGAAADVFEDATEATQGLTEAGQELAETTLTNLAPALEELADYYEAVHDATARSVESTIHGLEAIETPAQKARREFRSLNEELSDLSDEEINIRIAGESNVPTAQSILAGLESQEAYIDQYQKYLEQARAAGVSEDLLADLSDGSTESYDYLAALAGATSEQIEEINAAYGRVNEGKETFVDALTQQQLAADEVFQSIVDSCDQMIIDLDMADGAYDSLEATVQGMANGIAAAVPELQAQVDAVVAQLERLDSLGGFGMVGNRFTFGAKGRLIDGSFADGADYIPFDGFLAQLHEGESVLNAEEARIWRAFKFGGQSTANSIDYDALGSTIGSNVHAGGPVYLDGQIVGRVISAGQANSYRQLERSGWQR